jgi:hypothetical protein
VLLLASCGDSPTAPRTPLPEAPVLPPRNIGLEVAPVTGVAYVHTSSGMAPLADLPLRVTGYREPNSPVHIAAVTDENGRYAVQGLLREFVQVSVAPQEDYLSPCSLRRWLRGNEPLDLHVVPSAELLTAGIPATLRHIDRLYPLASLVRGFVTEPTSRGPRPVVGANVEHSYVAEQGTPTGFTITNRDGFYEVCQYFDDYAQEVRAHKDGYRTGVRAIGAESDINIEMRRE